MSQSNKKSPYPVITIRQREGTEGQLMAGRNTQVLLDGVPVRSATYVKLEIKSTKLAKVTLELYATVDEIEGMFDDIRIRQDRRAEKSEAESEQE
jgi:hypothetical protein